MEIIIPEFDDTIVIDDVDLKESNGKDQTQILDNSQEQHDDIDATDDNSDDSNIINDSTDDIKSNNSSDDITSYGENADAVAVATFEQMLENGLFTEEQKKEFDGSWEWINNGLKDLPQRVLNTIVAEAPDVTKAVLRFAFSSSDITIEDLKNFTKTYIDEITPVEITLDTMDEAREYLEKIYSERGIRPRVIESMLQVLEDDDELLSEAKAELDKQNENKKNTPKSEQLIADKENEELAKVQAQNAFANQLQEELNSIGWKPSKVNEVKQRFSQLNSILTEVYKNPKSLIKLTDFLGYYKNGDIDYTKFITTLETPIAKGIQSRIQDAVNSPTLSTKSNLKNPKSIDDGDEAII